jgi:hypothetical protein
VKKRRQAVALQNLFQDRETFAIYQLSNIRTK